MPPLRRVYLDHSATTPADERVVAAMLPFLTEKFGNASSVHFYGQEARAAVDRARREVARLINARPNDIIFTSGGTEANNLAIRGVAEMFEESKGHIVTSQIEHSAVRGVCDRLERGGWEITRLPVTEDGIVRAEEVEAAIKPETVLISVMLANNEIGTIQPVAEIGQIVRDRQANGQRHLYFHTDAVQAAGRIEVDVEALNCDLLTLAAHKMYAPKGIGALYARRGVRFLPQQTGGHQERERRAGTESVASIVAFGEAARLAREELQERAEHVRRLRDRFEEEIAARIPDIVFNGHRSLRLPHISNVSFRFIEGEGLLINLDMQGIAVSTGSACSSGSIEPSPVIRALGRNTELARGSIRFSLGKDTSAEDVDYVLQILPPAVENLRRLSPLYQKRMSDGACSKEANRPLATAN
jgi:cysteine desulfurase